MAWRLMSIANAFTFSSLAFSPNIASSVEFKDFLVMNVCTSGAVVDKTKIPGRDSCTAQRNLTTGESVHYHLRDFPNTTGTCKEKISGREITSIYVLFNNNIRALGYTDVGFDPNEDPTCILSASDPKFRDRTRAATEDRGSIRWVDSDPEGIGFLMASGDGVDLSYYTTPVCNTFPNDSRRFYDGWPLATRTLPALGTFGWRFQETKLTTAAADPPFAAFGSCPSDYNSGFTMWTLAPFRFKSGITLNTVVTYHYSNQQSQIPNPGLSKALEKAYFTDEWGFSRYELWRREDYYGTSTTDRQRTKDQAVALFNTGRCGTPYDTPRSPTPSMTTGTTITSGKYAEKIINSSSGSVPGEYWYIINCRDYTRLTSDPSSFLPSLMDLQQDYQAFWE